MSISHVIIGGGGHALSVTDSAVQQGLKIVGYTDITDTGELAPGGGLAGQRRDWPATVQHDGNTVAQ